VGHEGARVALQERLQRPGEVGLLASPVALDRTSVDAAVVEKEAEIYKAQMQEEGKPDNIIDKIVKGKIDKFYGEVCLLEKKFVKDPT
jgi:elongation factor Ts